MKLVRSILSVFLAFQVILVSMGFSMHHHYCMDRLMDSSFITHAESCMGMEEEDFEMECCEDTAEAVETDDTSLVKMQASPEQADLVLLYVVSTVILNEVPSNGVQYEYQQFRPPPLLRDIPVFNQAFLI